MTGHAPYASDPAQSRGRQHVEPGGEIRGPRTAFQRDRDRIIHSISFRRLRHKTQVFVAPDGDHFRVRLTHSLEVAQIARTIARALGLNEDLTEALALAHDIGHPPFGHAGERALQEALGDVGGFDHNGNTLRALMRIDSPYPGWRGLNLSWETLEGLAKHNGPVTNPQWALTEADRDFPLNLDHYASLEAQVAAIADDIAYDNHDIDDGLRAGILSRDALMTLPSIAARCERLAARFPDAEPAPIMRELVREQIGAMVSDVIATTNSNLISARIEKIDDVRTCGRQLVTFSDAMAAEERALKAFNYANLYHHPLQRDVATRAGRIVTNLVAHYRAHPDTLPEDWHRRLPDAEPERARHIGDFVAGMTDRYAIARHEELIGPADMPEGF